MRRIFRQPVEATSTINPDLWAITYDALHESVTQGYEQANVQYNVPNLAFSQRLRQSASVFAARKSVQQARLLAQAAVNPDGTQRSWSQFLAASRNIVQDYNLTWLRTEYDTAVRAARAAAQWGKFQETADLYPNLRYMESVAGFPRQEHKRFYGLVLPLNHPFWTRWMPPSAYGCMCSVSQTDDEPTLDELDQIPMPTPIAGLSHNPGISGRLFSEDHPYFTEVEISNFTDQTRALLIQSDQIIEVNTPSGAQLRVHPAYNQIEQQGELALQLADRYSIELPAAKADILIGGQAGQIVRPSTLSDLPDAKPNTPYLVLDLIAASARTSLDEIQEAVAGRSQKVIVVNHNNQAPYEL